MGRQVPFQTLDEVAQGLCREIENRGSMVESRTATTVRVGCETLRRLELDLRSGDGETLPPVHLYEAYWAPLTEGAVGLWHVVRFLLSGGWNGLRSDARLNRFMFERPRQFRINRRSLFNLAVVILGVIALLVIGMAIAVVAVARFTLEDSGGIDPLVVSHLTILFERLLGFIAGNLAVAIALIAVSRFLMPREKGTWRYCLAWIVNVLTVIPSALMLAALLFSAYVAIPVIFIFHQPILFAGRVCEWCTGLNWGAVVAAGAQYVRRLVERLLLCPLPEQSAWRFLIGLGILLVLAAVYSLIKPGHPRTRGGRITGLVLTLLALAGILALCGHGDALAFVTWLLLSAAVLFVRWFLIQFIGDVAIYVSPHVVDRFFDLRVRIREVVWRAARAVYACRDDDGNFLCGGVVVAGHSLGSVVVYDVLNRLINEDDLSDGATTECCDDTPVEDLYVSDRTKLLLTFGSPLDKTAFVFARHDPHGGTDRDALAASVQPLIVRERTFPWINLWTPFDILGGCLEFYDTPDRPEEPLPNKNRVINLVDPHAITPIAAHSEFWKNTLMYEVMCDALGVRGR